MKKIVSAILSLVMLMSLSATAFAQRSMADLGEIPVKNVEPDYREIVEQLFPRYRDEQISPHWTSGDPDAPNPRMHGFVTQTAYGLLRDSNTIAYTFYNGQRANLVRGSVLPDKDETYNILYLWHFYGEDGKNYLGGNVTAYTKCIEHYKNAVNLYKGGFKDRAMETLGRALHYLQDVNVPHHSMNALVTNSNHAEFEEFAEDRMWSYALTSLHASVYTDANKALGTTIDYYANFARGLYTHASSGDTDKMEIAASACVRSAQRATATVLYKFMFDVGYVISAR